ncbi:MAG: hypothetical protein HXX15_02745 [Rhodopseudomonas sp.]|nr:hypothetical protein [Rhodopseudomonas sp.]
MIDGVNKFYNSIAAASALKDSELVSLFVYYLTAISGEQSATVTSVSDCFKACDLAPPARVAPYLSEGLSSEPQKYIKANGGYKLQRHYRERLAAKFIEVNDPPEKALSNTEGLMTEDECKLLESLREVVPSAALSYHQALLDLRYNERMSFRGPALELREVLREVLDHMAPDEKVTGAIGFKLEQGRSSPTMKQKVRYILRSRGVGKTKSASPEGSASAVDEIVSNLTRSIYDLGSLATHVASERRQVLQVKRYIDAVLHDILATP